MARKGVFPALLASVLGLAVALPGVARADGPYHGGSDYDGPPGGGHYHEGPYPGRGPYHGPYPGREAYRAPYYAHYYGPYYPQHYYPPHYPAWPAYPPPGCTNCKKQQHHHNNHNGNNNDLWYGLLGGGALGYALGNVLPVPHLNQDYVPPPENTASPPGP